MKTQRALYRVVGLYLNGEQHIHTGFHRNSKSAKEACKESMIAERNEWSSRSIADILIIDHERISEWMDLIERETETPLEKLEKALDSHDWHYEMSDDPHVFKRGTDERIEIHHLARLAGHEGQNLLCAYQTRNGTMTNN